MTANPAHRTLPVSDLDGQHREFVSELEMHFGVVVATATATPKSTANEDAARVYVRDTDETSGVVVADGVGSVAGSGQAAAQVADHAAELLGAESTELLRVCLSASEMLRLSEQDGLCTLLTAEADPSGRVRAEWIGNGAIIEAMPMSGIEPHSPSQGRGGVRGPWMWVNHLLPHMALSRGVPALAATVGADPSTITTTSSLEWVASPAIPRLVLVCSDGVLAVEEQPLGTDASGAAWQGVPIPLMRIFESLGTWLDTQIECPADAAESSLDDALQDPLVSCLDEGLLDDDATIGALALLPVATHPVEGHPAAGDVVS